MSSRARAPNVAPRRSPAVSLSLAVTALNRASQSPVAASDGRPCKGRQRPLPDGGRLGARRTAAGAGEVAFVVLCPVTGADVATLPGGGEPSEVKSVCCCVRLLAFWARVGAGWLISDPPGRGLLKAAGHAARRVHACFIAKSRARRLFARARRSLHAARPPLAAVAGPAWREAAAAATPWPWPWRWRW